MDDLETLQTKQAIYEVVQRYCRGMDRLDEDLVRSCYHPEGTDTHYGLGTLDREGFIAKALRGGLTRIGGTMHSVPNHYVYEIDGDRARAESYMVAYHWGDEPQMNFTSGGRYVDLFERRDGEWRILERSCIREWVKQEPTVTATEPGPYRLGRRDRTDPSYAPLRGGQGSGRPGA